MAGSIASSATLGILIPPSINMIIYGAITDTSIGALFIASIIPGLMFALSFILIIIVASLLKPDITGDKNIEVDRQGRWLRLIDLIGPIFIFTTIIGSIYGGWATPTEAAAVGMFIVIMCELALLTPPAGMNLYIVQGVRNKGQITDVILGVLPFFFGILTLVVCITIWPDIVTWIPDALQ